MKRIKRMSLVISGLCAVSVLFTGCDTPGQSALAGAATGAAIGGVFKGGGRNVARGAVIGGVGGYALGKYGEVERERGYAAAQGGYAPPPQPVYAPPQREVYYAPEPPPAYHRHRHEMPYGRYSGTRGYVYSPYGGGLIDVRGIPRDAEVVDPRTGRVFLNP